MAAAHSAATVAPDRIIQTALGFMAAEGAFERGGIGHIHSTRLRPPDTRVENVGHESMVVGVK